MRDQVVLSDRCLVGLNDKDIALLGDSASCKNGVLTGKIDYHPAGFATTGSWFKARFLLENGDGLFRMFEAICRRDYVSGPISASQRSRSLGQSALKATRLRKLIRKALCRKSTATAAGLRPDSHAMVTVGLSSFPMPISVT